MDREGNVPSPPDVRRRLTRIYRAMLRKLGPQGWWPGRTPFEVIVGAILTQNTAWTNVEKAIRNLQEAELLSPRKLAAVPRATLARLIRSGGYYNIKAGRLQGFLGFLRRRHGLSLRRMFGRPPAALRRELLGVPGIGPETADSILLYAGDIPIFVVDAYTRRILARHGVLRPDAGYDESMELDLGVLEPLVAMPSNPDNVVPISKAEGIKVDQVMVGSCTNGSYTDLKAVAQIVKGRRVHPDVTFFIHPSSRADMEVLAREGLLADLIAAGVNVEAATCGACIGVGHVPAKGMKSLRAINRNFKGRTGQKDDEVYLSSSEVAAATAVAGVITDPRKLGITAPAQEMPRRLDQENPSLVPPASPAEAPGLPVVKGDNITGVPLKGALTDALKGEVLIKLGDDVSTDHIMPAGSQILRYRSNIPKLADYVFNRVDPEFAARARAKGGGFIVGGKNYGQGSSREHAAIAPMYLGVTGVIVKAFARIHLANLINWGIVPMTFADPSDHERVGQGDVLEIPDVRRQIVAGADLLAVKNMTRGTSFKVALALNRRERDYLLAGGKLAHTKANPLH